MIGRAARRLARWARDATAPAWIVVLSIMTATGCLALIYWRIEDTRHDTAYAQCLQANEFRGFLGDYLESQSAGSNLTLRDVPGFDDLDPPTRRYFARLDDFIFLARENAALAAAEYRREFPVRDC